MKSAKILLMVTVVSVILSAAVSQALASTGYGRFAPSNDVTQSFDRYKINSKLNYYFCGSQLSPDAIIGVEKAYTLDSTLWQPIEEPTPKALRSLVSNMQTVHSTSARGAGLSGYTLLDGMGMPIGVWYSRLFGATTFVRMEDGGKVQIQTVRSHHEDK
jgi:hypothetical protein